MEKTFTTTASLACSLLTVATLQSIALSCYADPHHGDTKSSGAEIVKTLALAAGAGSGDVHINGQTNRLYISNFNNSTLTVLDGNTDSVIETIPVGDGTLSNGGLIGPTVTAIDEKKNIIYVLNDNGILSVLDGITDQILYHFSFDTSPSEEYGIVATQDMVRSKKTGKLYISNAGVQIDVVDPRLRKAVNVIPNDGATFVAINQKTNKIYVTQYWEGTVLVIDGDTDRIVDTIVGVGEPAAPEDCYLGPQGSAGCTNKSSGLDHIAVDEERNRIYVVGVNDGRFVTIDSRTHKVIRTLFIHPGQFTLAINPQTHDIYTINFATSQLSIIDGEKGVITATLPLGAGFSPADCYSDQTQCTAFGDLPSSVAVNAKTGKIYTLNSGDIFNPQAESELLVIKDKEAKGER